MAKKFSNAARGISRVFWAQLLVIIGTICASISLSGLIGEAGPSAFAVILGLVGTIIMIIALIFEVTGFYTAGKDHPDFKKSFDFILAALIVSVVFAIIQAIWPNTFNGTAARIVSILTSLLELLAFYFAIRGGSHLLRERNEEKTAKFGERAWTIYISAILVALLIVILSLLNVPAVVNGILAIIALIVGLVGEISIIVFFGKTKNRLD